jgi:hypothetical protein
LEPEPEQSKCEAYFWESSNGRSIRDSFSIVSISQVVVGPVASSALTIQQVQ